MSDDAEGFTRSVAETSTSAAMSGKEVEEEAYVE